MSENHFNFVEELCGIISCVIGTGPNRPAEELVHFHQLFRKVTSEEGSRSAPVAPAVSLTPIAPYTARSTCCTVPAEPFSARNTPLDFTWPSSALSAPSRLNGVCWLPR